MASTDDIDRFFDAVNDAYDALLDAVKTANDRGYRVSRKLIDEVERGQREAVYLTRRLETAPRDVAGFYTAAVRNVTDIQGRTLDLSMSGCKIESGAAVTRGLAFECRLHVPGLDWPLRIDEAVVRWVAGDTFGLEFTRLRPEEQAKLKTVIQNLELGS